MYSLLGSHTRLGCNELDVWRLVSRSLKARDSVQGESGLLLMCCAGHEWLPREVAWCRWLRHVVGARSG